MLIKNRRTGVVLKATPRLAALAVRESHFEFIEDEDYLDLQEVRNILGAADKAGEPGVEEVLKNLESIVKDKLAERAKAKKAEPEKAPEKEPEPEKDSGTGEPSPKTDEYSEIEAKVQSLMGDEKDKDHKDALETMARESFGVELDKRKNLSTLKQEVLALIAEHRSG